MKTLTLSQFAALHNKSKPTISKYLNNGQILGIRVGHAWQITIEESDRYMAEGLLPLPSENIQPGDS